MIEKKQLIKIIFHIGDLKENVTAQYRVKY